MVPMKLMKSRQRQQINENDVKELNQFFYFWGAIDAEC